MPVLVIQSTVNSPDLLSILLTGSPVLNAVDGKMHLLHLPHKAHLEPFMAVKRIVANVAAENITLAAAFYSDILGLSLVMDLGWIQTYSTDGKAAPQISIASEGGSGTPVPDLSIEVDNLDEILQLISDAKIPIEYGPTVEPWGVRRFYVRDPFNRLINILEH